MWLAMQLAQLLLLFTLPLRCFQNQSFCVLHLDILHHLSSVLPLPCLYPVPGQFCCVMIINFHKSSSAVALTTLMATAGRAVL